MDELPESLIEAAAPVLREVHRTTVEALAADDQPRSALFSAKKAQRIVSGIAESHPQRVTWDCNEGCYHCCYMPVSISALEALRLADRFRKILMPTAVDKTLGKVRRRVQEQDGMNWNTLQSSDLACGLLGDGGSCSVYLERPIACRAHVSYDVNACKGVPDESGDDTVPYDGELAATGHAARVGLHLAIEDSGFQPRHYELNEALLRAVETEDAASRWLNGEDVFAGCLEELPEGGS